MAGINISGNAAQPIPAVLAAAFGTPSAVPPLHRDVQGVVARALTSARASGRDYLGQTEAAVRAVTAVRPDLSTRQATLAVMWVRDHTAE